MEMLGQALQQNQELVEFLENVSNGSIRRAVEFLACFVGSGHVDNEKILRIIQDSSKYYLPFHEFLNAVIYGDNRYYFPEDSPIINVFDIATNSPREHFLLLQVLAYIDKSGANSKMGGAYLSLSTLYDYFQVQEFDIVQISNSIERAKIFQLVSFASVSGYELGQRLRITPAGCYCYKVLPTHFSYVDAMVVDTPVCIKAHRDNIYDTSKIEERLSRATCFLDYLDEVWRISALDDTVFDWSTHSSALRRSIAEIIERVERKNKYN